MSDHSELKRLLEACKESNCADASDFGRRIADLYDYLDPETVAEMVAENEALQQALFQAQEAAKDLGKDAERYRFLRRTECWEDAAYPGPWIVSSHDGVDNQDGEALDAAVDAAMSKEG